MNQVQQLKFGLAGGPLQATKVLAKRLTGGYWKGDAWAVIAVEPGGTYTAANIYPGKGFGARYNPEHYRHPFRPEVLARKLAQGYQDVTDDLPEEIREYVQVVSATSDKSEGKAEAKPKAKAKAAK